MISAQESQPLGTLREAATSLTKIAGETLESSGPLGLPFARLTDSASIFTTGLPKHFLSKHSSSSLAKALQRTQSAGSRKVAGPAQSKARPVEPESSNKRGKVVTERKRRQTVVMEDSTGGSRSALRDVTLSRVASSPEERPRSTVATLSLSHAAFGEGVVGVLDGQRTWHRADFVFEDELSKGPDVQWYQLTPSRPQKSQETTSEQEAVSSSGQETEAGPSRQKHMHRKWHFKRVERQAQIAKRLEKLGKRSGLLQQLASGAFAGVVSRSFVAPLDLIKTHLVTGHGSRGAPKTAAVVAAKIFEEGGWKAFFRGNGINCLRVAPCKAIELCVFENLKRALSKDEGSLMSFVAAPVAGGAAGMMSTVATYPLELMRTRMMVQPHLYTSISRTFHKIVAEEGAGALYSGLRPSVLGVFPYAAANYGVYAGLRSAYKRVTKKDYVPTVPTLLFGAAAASCSSALTFPLEVARRQMQLGTVGGKAVYKNALDVVQTIYKEEGFLALYRGLGTTCVKLIPAAAVSCMCYEAARLALRVDDASIKKRENEKEALKEEEEGLALQAEVE